MSAAFDPAPAAARMLPPLDAGTLHRAQAFLQRRWVAVGATAVAVLLAAILALQLIPPHYAARADVLLDPRRDKAFGPDDVAGAINLDTASVAALCRKRTRM